MAIGRRPHHRCPARDDALRSEGPRRDISERRVPGRRRPLHARILRAHAGAVGTYAWRRTAPGGSALVAVSAAVVGTMMLGGDLWFETFAVPSIADSPAGPVFDSDPRCCSASERSRATCSSRSGGLFGIASFRARVFPQRPLHRVVIGGIIGFQALIAPFAIPLGSPSPPSGVWMIRTTHSVNDAGAFASN